MRIGIRELRSNLAEILDEVDKGTVVTITKHGRPRATIQPIVDEDEVIARGIQEGWLSAGPGFLNPRQDRRPKHTIRLPPGVTVEQLIDEDRGE